MKLQTRLKRIEQEMLARVPPSPEPGFTVKLDDAYEVFIPESTFPRLLKVYGTPGPDGGEEVQLEKAA